MHIRFNRSDPSAYFDVVDEALAQDARNAVNAYLNNAFYSDPVETVETAQE